MRRRAQLLTAQEKIATGLACEDVKVRFNSLIPIANVQTRVIGLPPLPEEIDEATEINTRSWLGHEVGHLKYQSQPWPAKLVRDKVLKELAFGLEDCRTDREMGEEYPGIKEDRRAGFDLVRDELPAKNVLQAATFALYEQVKEYFTQDDTVAYWTQRIGDPKAATVIEALLNAIPEQIKHARRTKSSAEVIKVCREIKEIWKEFFKDGEDGEGDGEGDPNDKMNDGGAFGKKKKDKKQDKKQGKGKPQKSDDDEDGEDGEDGDSGSSSDSDDGDEDKENSKSGSAKSDDDESEDSEGDEDSEGGDESNKSEDGDESDEDDEEDSDESQGGDESEDDESGEGGESGGDESEDDESDEDSDESKGDKSEDSDEDESGSSGSEDDEDDEDESGSAGSGDDDDEAQPEKNEKSEAEKEAEAEKKMQDMMDDYKSVSEQEQAGLESRLCDDTDAEDYDWGDCPEGYRPYTAHDQEIVLDAAIAPASFRSEVKSKLGVMQRRLLMDLMAKRRLWIADREHGEIDDTRLARVPTGDRRVYKRKLRRPALNIAVQVVLDMSGSMAGSEMYLCGQLGYILGESLALVRVPYEVVGFTTGYKNSCASSVEPMVPGVYYHRTLPLKLIEIKPFSMTSRHEMLGRFYAAAQFSGGGTVEGEAIWWAAKRLAVRPEQRKLLITVCDGGPCGTPAPSSKYEEHVTNVIGRIRRHGIETIHVGIQTDAPLRYVPEESFVRYDGLNDLLTGFYSQLGAILRGEKRRSMDTSSVS